MIVHQLTNTQTIDASVALSTTTPVDITDCGTAGVQIVYPASCVGMISIQGSLDGVNFAQLSTISISSAAGSQITSYAPTPLRAIQVSYAKTSGTGIISVIVTGKTTS